MNRVQYQAVAAGALLLTLPESLRQEPTNPAAAVVKSPIILRPGEMRWEDCSAAIPPGAKCATVEGDRTAANVPFAYRLKMPDRYHVPPHFHPADEHLTVIAGTVNIGFGDKFDVKITKPMPVGSFIVIPRRTRHFVWTRGETIVQVQAIGPWGVSYVNPADDPRKR